ncbi:hypothetical protein OHB24_34280 [Kribbella sp. NBC_00482]|uniref:hypothetical protein n=1 Tax=Kribbella sp. NBC_00482 TaxID=2975968 RepID=UPI002E17DAEB
MTSPTAVPDEVARAGRERLAEWLTAQASERELGATPEQLADWTAYQVEEYLLFVPPGYANLMFLVADHGIRSFAPSEMTVATAIAAARARTEPA